MEQMDAGTDKNKFTISKTQALEICAECNEFGIKGCMLADIEGCKTELIPIIPGCILRKITPIDNERTIKNNNEKPKRTISQKTHKNAQSKKEDSAFSGKCRVEKKPPITKTEEEIMGLLLQGINDTNRIAKMRNCKRRIVQTHIKNLKNKGIINFVFEDMRLGGGTNAQSAEIYRETKQEKRIDPKPQLPTGSAGTCRLVKPIRLHGEQFSIGILEKQDSYFKRIGKRITIDHNTIMCNKESIDIYSNTSFFGENGANEQENVREACDKSMEYWNRIFSVIENDLKITIIKERAQNIRMVKTGHYAEIGSEMAIDAEEKSYKIQIRTTDDKKVWFLIDNSFNFHEAETVHSQTSKVDMQEAVERNLNDWRDNMGMPKQSELTLDLKKLTELTTENAAGLNAVFQILRILIPKQEKITQPEQKPKDDPGGYQ